MYLTASSSARFYALMASGSLILSRRRDQFAQGLPRTGRAIIALHADSLCRLLGRSRDALRHCRRLGSSSSEVCSRQLYGRDPLYGLLLDLRARLRTEDVLRARSGARKGAPYSVPPDSTPLSSEFFFLTGYRMFMVAIGRARGRHACSSFSPLRASACASAPARLDLETVSALGVNVRMLRTLNFGLGIYLAGLAGVLAAGQIGLAADRSATFAAHAELRRHHRRRSRLLTGTLLGGLLIGARSGHHRRCSFRSASEAVIYVMMALVLVGPPARPARRGRQDDVTPDLRNEWRWLPSPRSRPSGRLLVATPFWMTAGRRLHRARRARVLVLGLAAMSLNFLL